MLRKSERTWQTYSLRYFQPLHTKDSLYSMRALSAPAIHSNEAPHTIFGRIWGFDFENNPKKKKLHLQRVLVIAGRLCHSWSELFNKNVIESPIVNACISSCHDYVILLFISNCIRSCVIRWVGIAIVATWSTTYVIFTKKIFLLLAFRL